jgi:peptidoglycan/xylan/chitin deacetylase (PgdA/CDA1 family)
VRRRRKEHDETGIALRQANGLFYISPGQRLGFTGRQSPFSAEGAIHWDVKTIPHYYSDLAPFRELFLTGQPILTYHNVGPRKRGVKIKGLYVSPKLFARQMAELRAAEFCAPSHRSLFSREPNQPACVWITFDDGFCDVFEHALPVLRRHSFSSIQFLVAGLLGKTNEWMQKDSKVVERLMDEAQIRDWLAAGQEIGSHTMTHPRLTQLSQVEAREQITASKKSLEDRFGVPINHFCYPFGDWNPAVRDLVVAAGYQTACTTITGLNTGAESPFELKRFTARYPSRSLKAIWKRLTH